MRVKQFEDKIEEQPDFITLRNHFAKTVSGDGKRIMLVNTLWRLLRLAYRISGNVLDEEPKPTPEPEESTPEPVAEGE